MFKSIRQFWNKRISKEPWLEIISEGIEDDGRVRLEFDWNPAFIEHIREHGFIGHNEEECVKLYVEALTNKHLQENEAPGLPAPTESTMAMGGVPSNRRIRS